MEERGLNLHKNSEIINMGWGTRDVSRLFMMTYRKCSEPGAEEGTVGYVVWEGHVGSGGGR